MHQVQFPRGKGIQANAINFLVGQIITDAKRGGSSKGVIGFGDLAVEVTIRCKKWREKPWQFWRPKRS